MFTATLAAFALAAGLSLPVAAPAPVPSADLPIPSVTADSWIVYDLEGDTVLASWNANDRRPMASVTKVMTAMIVVENASLDEVVTIPSFATGTRGSTAGLVAGEQWTVYDLLVATMVRSGNDAALALAWHVGDGSVDAFVAMMNAKARELGMSATTFANPNGLDNEEHVSTANDLLTLTKASLDYPVIQDIARIRVIAMPADPSGRSRDLKNTNALLGAYPGVVGLKTGDTPWADKVLLTVAERGNRTILAVVMHSDDHFSDTRELLDWAYATGGIRDRWLRVFYAEQGGGAVGVSLELSESHERRLQGLRPLDTGRWRMSKLSDLPKAASLGEWLKDVLPGAVGGEG